MKLDISLQQKQKLSMTTELRQSIEILQYNQIELKDFLVEESQENPTLEVEYNFDEYDFYPNNKDTYVSEEKDEVEEDLGFEKFVSSEETLFDYVYEQIVATDFTDSQRKIAEYLLNLLDENGYLKIDLYDFSNRYNYSFEEVENVIEILQDFYPIGIFSKDLPQCLLKQAESKSYDDLTKSIIREDLVDLAENRVELLAKKYGVSNLEIQERFDLIRGLEPKPGKFLSFNDAPIKYIFPDLFLEIQDKSIFLYYNEDVMPKVSVNNFYKNLLKQNVNEETKSYLLEKFKKTNWIIKSIEQRRETIMKIANAICEVQKNYILGTGYMQPLTMKDIADIVDVHESTVSRTVNGKYIQAPGKIYELKDFFKGAIESDDGDVSTDEIKLFIRTSIETEDKRRPISDQKITDNLKKLGYKISRRTVAKYRDSMGILASSKRKRY